MPAFLAGPSGWLGPYFNLLPCLTIGLFIWQQKMFMPPAADEQAAMQQKVMQYMMIFMGVMFFKVASGLCLYFIASSLWGIAERKLLPRSTIAKGTAACRCWSALGRVLQRTAMAHPRPRRRIATGDKLAVLGCAHARSARHHRGHRLAIGKRSPRCHPPQRSRCGPLRGIALARRRTRCDAARFAQARHASDRPTVGRRFYGGDSLLALCLAHCAATRGNRRSRFIPSVRRRSCKPCSERFAAKVLAWLSRVSSRFAPFSPAGST